MAWLDDIIVEVKNKLEGVSEIGRVHDFERRISNEAELRQHCIEPGGQRVRFWTISWSAAAAADETTRAVARRHELVLRGYAQVNDSNESEKEFRALVESVFTAFLSDRRLNNQAHRSGPLSVRAIQYRRFGGVLVHYAECVLPVEQYPVTY